MENLKGQGGHIVSRPAGALGSAPHLELHRAVHQGGSNQTHQDSRFRVDTVDGGNLAPPQVPKVLGTTVV